MGAEGSRCRHRLSAVCAGAAPFALALFLWWALAHAVQCVRGVPFPTPVETAQRLWALARGGRLLEHTVYRHVVDSLLRWGVGFLLAAVFGLGLGLALGWWRRLERFLMPLVHMLQLVPGLAWIPVALLCFGVGERATVFMIAVTAFAPIVINVAGGVKRVDDTHVRAARMLGAGGWSLFFRVLVPGALPHILSGLRIGPGNGWRVLVAGEMIVGTGTGLGYAIIQARWTLDYASALACVCIICVVGMALERGVMLPIERRTVDRWGLPRSG